MMTLAAFAALCEAYLGIWPNIELFHRLIYFKTQTADAVPIVCRRPPSTRARPWTSPD
jgi:hypothetical protein